MVFWRMKHWLVGFVALLLPLQAQAGQVRLLNVSYDPTREFYDEFNPLFVQHWKSKTGQDVVIDQSHGGSGKQARSVIDGLKADVVTLALAYDIDAIAQRTQLLPADWQARLPHASSPFVSTIVFLVRKGNPKQIKDWGDLVREDVKVITPNPKTSGGARWNYLAALAYARQTLGTPEAVEDFLRKLYANVPVLDSGARGSTTTFVQRGMGDVLISWENEALLARSRMGQGAFDIVYPSITVLAQPPVAVIDGNAREKDTLEAANEYLAFHYTPQAQRLGAKHFLRPSDSEIAKEFTSLFPEVPFVTIQKLGGWAAVQKEHFDDGGLFDRIMVKKEE
jgi:sulfate/thiosulfate-binding protein